MQVETVGKNYKYTLSFLPSGNPVVSGRCDICTFMEAVGTVKRLSKSLAAKIKTEAAPGIATQTPNDNATKAAPQSAATPKTPATRRLNF